MIRCSRPMSCAVASTWPSGGRRSTQWWSAVSVTPKVRFEWPPAISSNDSGGATCGHVLAEPGGHVLDVDALWRLLAIPRFPLDGCAHRSSHAPWDETTTLPVAGPGTGTAGAPPILCRCRSTSPTRPSRPRSSSAPSRPRSSSTCGRRGAVRAGRSGRSSSRWSTTPTARSCWPRSTSTRTPRSPRPFQVQGIPAVYALARRQGRRRLRRRPGPEAEVQAFVDRLLPSAEADRDRAAARRRRRGVAAPGARARARPRRTRSSRWPSSSSPTARRRGARRCSPASPRRAETRRVAALARIRRRRRRGRRHHRPSSTRCSTGSRTTTTPARSTSTCSSCWVPTTRARRTTAAAHRPAVLSRDGLPPGSPGPATDRPADIAAPGT